MQAGAGPKSAVPYNSGPMDVPGTLVAVIIVAYWLGAGAMIVRVRRHARRHEQRAAEVLPKQPLERAMGLVWVPLIACWMVLPWLALSRSGLMFGLLGTIPTEGEQVELENLRFTAEKVQGRRVTTVLVVKSAPPAE